MSGQKAEFPPFKARELVDDRGQDSLLEFRARSWMRLGWAAVPFLFPFAMYSFYISMPAMGLLTMLVIILLSINSFFIYKTNKQIVTDWVFFAVLLFTLLYAETAIGIYALFWCYPALFGVAFISERSLARTMTMISLSTLIPFSFWFLNTGIAIRFSITLCMLCIFSDLLVVHLNKLQLRLTEFAIRDPLTNAFNRRQMELYLNEAIEETKRGFGPASVLLLDIDHFKLINDTFGHETGDSVLKNLVDILHKRQRKLDYVFRVGGEEFLILLRNTDLKQAVTTAESLRLYIEGHNFLEDKTVTASFGAAEYKAEESFDKWLARTDHNLYEAKNLGRNCVQPAIASFSNKNI